MSHATSTGPPHSLIILQICSTKLNAVTVCIASIFLSASWMVSQSAARRNLTFVLRENDLSLAMTRLHDYFFTETH